MATKRWEEVEPLLRESMAILEASGQRDRWSQAAGIRGYGARGRGQPDEAWRYFADTLQTAVDINGFVPLLFAIPGIALLLADEGEVERAVELYAPLTFMPLVANSRLRDDLAGEEIKALAESLPAEVAAAAQKRGLERDLWETAGQLLNELARRGLD